MAVDDDSASVPRSRNQHFKHRQVYMTTGNSTGFVQNADCSHEITSPEYASIRLRRGRGMMGFVQPMEMARSLSVGRETRILGASGEKGRRPKALQLKTGMAKELSSSSGYDVV